MLSLPLSVTRSGYSYKTILGEHDLKPFGGFLISFLDTDFVSLFQRIDELTAEYAYVVRHKEDVLNDYYDTLSGQLTSEEVFDPLLCQLVINETDRIERPYFLSGQEYTQDLISKISKWRHLMLPLQDVVNHMLGHPLAEWPADMISLYNHLIDLQDIHTHFSLSADGFVQTYHISDILSMLSLELYQVQFNRVVISRCRNCGRFFIPAVRADEKYCDRLFENGRTCKDVGYLRHTDVFQKSYRTAYKAQKARCRYHLETNPDYEEQHFVPWNKAALAAKKEYQAKNDPEGFAQWLKDNRNAF